MCNLSAEIHKRKFPMIETMRKRIEQIVEQACVADTNIFGYDIWTHHILNSEGGPKRKTACLTL